MKLGLRANSDMPKWYPWVARITMLLLCVIVAFLVYTGAVLGHIGFCGLKGQDWLALVVFSFGIYATINIILRYLSNPTPEIRVANRLPSRLGPSEPLAIPQNATDEQRRYVETVNRKRQYAAHHVEVWNFTVPWWLRPLVLRIAPEGCHIRFKFTLTSEGHEKAMLGGQWLVARWNDNPEPVGRAGFEMGTAATNRRLAKLFPTEKSGHLDAYPFTVAFAIKREGEEEFYHFNDESYAVGLGWQVAEWKLGQGVYRVDVRLTGYGMLRASTATFRLSNLGTSLQEWVLEEF